MPVDESKIRGFKGNKESTRQSKSFQGGQTVQGDGQRGRGGAKEVTEGPKGSWRGQRGPGGAKAKLVRGTNRSRRGPRRSGRRTQRSGRRTQKSGSGT